MTPGAEPFTPERLQDTLRHLPATSVYWVGFSGGADSTALLHAMSNHVTATGQSLRALHVNHGIHPDADSWQEHCRAVCAEWGVEFHARRIEIDRGSGKGLEAEARHRRYAVVEDILDTGDVFLTAHHLDDQAETLLLNLVRGSGVDGLAAMPESRPLGKGFLARPLLAFEMQSLRDYLQAHGLKWIEDPGNLDPAYDRNYVRAELLPLMDSRWPGLARRLARSAVLCREASDVLARHAEEILGSTLVHPMVLNMRVLRDRKEDFGLVLRQWLRNSGASPLPFNRLDELRRQIHSASPDSMARIDWNGWAIRCFRNHLWLQQGEEPQACASHDWTDLHPLDLGGGHGILRLEPPAELPFTLSVRARAAGDTIRLKGHDHHRRVKDLLREMHVPPWLRDSIPLVCRGDAVLAVADRFIGAELAEALGKTGARLVWRPEHPVLQFVFRKLEN